MCALRNREEQVVKASILDLRRRMKDVLRALDRNESVKILYRGKEKGILRPSPGARSTSVVKHPAFGMWKGRTDMRNVPGTVRKMRKGRVDAL